jgi:hypothetical protein
MHHGIPYTPISSEWKYFIRLKQSPTVCKSTRATRAEPELSRGAPGSLLKGMV